MKNAKGFKAFDKGLICRGKHYAENTVFEEASAVICQRGMHYCTNPFDVLDYYSLVDDNGEIPDFAEVEALATPKTDDNKKFCTTKLQIGAKLSLGGFITACVDYLMKKTKSKSGNSAQMASSGYYAQMASSGDCSKMASSGIDSVICCAGVDGQAKAKKGSWITLSEWTYSEEKRRMIPVCVKTEQVDGERIKEDTFYALKNGVFVEVPE